jgi:hypothetical protein
MLSPAKDDGTLRPTIDGPIRACAFTAVAGLAPRPPPEVQLAAAGSGNDASLGTTELKRLTLS